MADNGYIVNILAYMNAFLGAVTAVLSGVNTAFPSNALTIVIIVLGGLTTVLSFIQKVIPITVQGPRPTTAGTSTALAASNVNLNDAHPLIVKRGGLFI